VKRNHRKSSGGMTRHQRQRNVGEISTISEISIEKLRHGESGGISSMAKAK